MEKINFIFFGRLEDEKGFDLILNLIEKLKNNSNIHFFIFGKGKYELNLISGHWKNVEFFGWKDKSFIKSYLKKSHYTLMPSMFLETFGLTALESLAEGVPVVGFSKGGLEKFVINDLDISRQSGNNLNEKFFNLIYNLVDKFSFERWQVLSDNVKLIANNYSIEKWIVSIEKLNIGKKILLVSDYLPKIGGIENYIYDVKDILTAKGYEVELFGWNGISGKISKKEKILGLPFTGFNLLYFLKLRKVIAIFKPDTIRIHSVGRFLGWLPLLNLRNFKGKKYIMYHDLGYFHPYPSKIYNENEVDTSFSLNNFLASSKTTNPLKNFTVFLKYLSAISIRYFILKYIDYSLIPSAFMTKIVINYGVKSDKIYLLEHFIKNDN